jgi:uncharacterized protein
MAILERETPKQPRPQIRGKYLSLTSYRRDGSPVATPLWFVEDRERFYVITSANSYKAKRIRRNSEVTIAQCTGRGELRGEPIPAHAAFLPESERAQIDRMMAEKYRVDRILVLPIYRLVMKLRGKAYGGDEAYLAITPSV